LIVEHEPVGIYVGNPINLSGQSSKSAEKALAFAEKLRSDFKLPVALVDERLSTVSATNAMRQSGVNAKDARSKIDMAAAVAILEQALAIERAKDV
jgi:putative Holliday junction resolvase